MSKQPLIEITWRDHWCDTGESGPPDWADEVTWTSVGWLLRETKELVSIASHRYHNDGTTAENYGDVTHIWKALIVSRKTLRK